MKRYSSSPGKIWDLGWTEKRISKYKARNRKALASAPVPGVTTMVFWVVVFGMQYEPQL